MGIHIFLKNMPRESFEIFVERENCSFGEKNDWNFRVFLLIPRWLFSKMRGLDGDIFLRNSLTENEVRENLYFLELTRWKGDVDKDFIRWKEFRSNFLFVSRFDFRYSRKTDGNIFYNRLSVRIFLLFAIVLYLGTRDFFPFSRLKKKRKQKFYHVRR